MTTGDNIKVSESVLRRIRALDDFDLRMLLSEINDHGWDVARKLLDVIEKTNAEREALSAVVQ